MKTPPRLNPERARLADARDGKAPWKKWGPYLSERQWGTVREDYSDNGDAWNSFTHDQARSRAYRWGEDGLAGISDDRQQLCFALALWNGKDPILKERLFGLSNGEGNHGEDVKEYYFYLDSTPTHSYMKYLYKYPHAAFPYDDLVETNRRRTRQEFEYELIDTGVFEGDRYFDVFVEYAKESPESLLVRISVHNRGPEPAELHVLPTLWFRKQHSPAEPDPPMLRQVSQGSPDGVIVADHPRLGIYYLYCEGAPAVLFTNNESNEQRLFGTPNPTPYVKDGIGNYIVGGQKDAVNPQQEGTKASPHYHVIVAGGATEVIRLCLTDTGPTDLASGNGSAASPFGSHFAQILAARRNNADEFYASVIPPSVGADAANVMRQALAGMLWGKQYYHYDVARWLREHGSEPHQPAHHAAPRNDHWHHMYCADIISMPDKWEYPWFAAWDLAFHVLALSPVDEDFAKHQLELMLHERYLHPNGQLPAYEWNFGDVNPPVHAWSTIFTYRLAKARTGRGDLLWLERCFQKLVVNFTWWVNRKDCSGRNVFEGGFLGLDNIGVFDRSASLPTGGRLEQADGTAWMGLFSLSMFEIATELAMTNPAYVDMCLKFAEHFLWIASAMIHLGEDTGMWDEADGFFYDVLRLPDGRSQRLKVRSIVGLLPLCAAAVYDAELPDKYPQVAECFRGFLAARPELVAAIHDPRRPGTTGRLLGAILNEDRLHRVLAIMLDENEFLSPHGIRALSRYHAEHPYVFRAGGQEYRVAYTPAESDAGMFGGNSNWRGPIWMPVNVLILRALLHYYGYYGDTFLVECPTGSGRSMTLYQVAEEIGRRLAGIFLRDSDGRRPVFGGTATFQQDPHWRDYIPFHEYFHGDNGAGLGASHQTGWSGAIAVLLDAFATVKPEGLLAGDKATYFERGPQELPVGERPR